MKMLKLKKTFTSNKNLQVVIELSEDGEEITVLIENKRIGEIYLSEINNNHCLQNYYIRFLGLDKCKGQGIGRECLKFHKEYFGCPLTAASNDGIKQDDGSHLVNDGAGFIEKMRQEGIVEKDTAYDDD